MRTTLSATPLAGLVVVDIEYHTDERGFFIEPWNKRDFAEAGLNLEFVQEGHSRSSEDVLRGMHYQDKTAPMGKLVRCTLGVIYDVAVDLRPASSTYGQWYGLRLSAANKLQIYVPPGFAHGFQTLSIKAEVQYKQTGYYLPNAEGTLAWDDPEVGVLWPRTPPILSNRDRRGQSFKFYRDHPAFGDL